MKQDTSSGQSTMLRGGPVQCFAVLPSYGSLYLFLAWNSEANAATPICFNICFLLKCTSTRLHVRVHVCLVVPAEPFSFFFLGDGVRRFRSDVESDLEVPAEEIFFPADVRFTLRTAGDSFLASVAGVSVSVVSTPNVSL